MQTAQANARTSADSPEVFKLASGVIDAIADAQKEKGISAERQAYLSRADNAWTIVKRYAWWDAEDLSEEMHAEIAKVKAGGVPAHLKRGSTFSGKAQSVPSPTSNPLPDVEKTPPKNTKNPVFAAHALNMLSAITVAEQNTSNTAGRKAYLKQGRRVWESAFSRAISGDLTPEMEAMEAKVEAEGSKVPDALKPDSKIEGVAGQSVKPMAPGTPTAQEMQVSKMSREELYKCWDAASTAYNVELAAAAVEKMAAITGLDFYDVLGTWVACSGRGPKVRKAGKSDAGSEGIEPTEPPTREEAYSIASKEWAGNVGGCRDAFVSERIYAGYRRHELAAR